MHGSREIEAATDGQIEVQLDGTRNHGRYGPGTQGLLQRPEHVLVFARLNQDQPMRIEPKLLQAMAVEVAIGRERRLATKTACPLQVHNAEAARASTKPSAAGRSRCVFGDISCSKPQLSPPPGNRSSTSPMLNGKTGTAWLTPRRSSLVTTWRSF